MADIPRLFVLDGGKALHKAVTDTFGKYAAIQRCQVHKKRNVLSHLPKSEQNNVGLAISQAYLEFDYDKAKKELLLIADNLEYRYPTAANSLLEGLEETLTVHQLKLPALLRQTLCTTNPMESANSVCMGIVRRIKNWKNGEMILRNITVETRSTYIGAVKNSVIYDDSNGYVEGSNNKIKAIKRAMCGSAGNCFVTQEGGVC